MNEQLSPDIAAVDALLRDASQALAYPPAPALAASVLERIEREGHAPVAGWWARPLVRMGAALAVAVVVIAGVATAIPQSRSALADFFGLSNVRVEVVPEADPSPPKLSPGSFARPSTLAEAVTVADFELRFPTRGGVPLIPDAVYLQGEEFQQPVVIFVFEDEEFDLYQSRRGQFGKGGPDPDTFREIEFDGLSALWIDEGGHIASFFDDQGRLVVESERSVERATLLWEQDGITHRLETSLSLDEAIDVARSLE